ncbi:MAG: 30S ribosomal protein S20 [Candidatus Delongbacteria bacterium]|nr:30S ribosomal protein S20 [Candidatus Delongbacteria bacterium]MBN2834618.1 30S ribosomal protein S20 [Candidatus Delongbacteria bacterium]
MPHHLSAKKRLKKSKKENAYNRHYKSMMKTAVKKVRTAENAEAAEANFIMAQSILDKLVIKGVIKKNNASNKKSKLRSAIAKMA